MLIVCPVMNAASSLEPLPPHRGVLPAGILAEPARSPRGSVSGEPVVRTRAETFLSKSACYGRRFESGLELNQRPLDYEVMCGVSPRR